jgi:anti-sigma-K factor RskA
MKDHAQFAEDLPLYAMGALDDQACPDLEAHLRTCAECRRELDALRGDLAMVALSATGPQPPQRARQRLTQAIAAEPQSAPGVPPGMVVGRLRPRWLSLAPIAIALVMAVTSLGLLLEVQRLKNAQETLRNALETLRQESAHDREIVAMLKDPKLQQNILVPVKHNSQQPQVKTIYVRDKGHVLLIANNLAELPSGKAYQLWLMTGEGHAMPCLTFKTDWRGHSMKLYSMDTAGVEAKGFAITVEPEAGSDTPTPPILMSSTP